MKLKNCFLVKKLTCKKARFFPTFFEKLAFYGVDMEPEPEPEPECIKSELEQEPKLFKSRDRNRNLNRAK
jgi:hypothetical protein